jgi:hypothetical protein
MISLNSKKILISLLVLITFQTGLAQEINWYSIDSGGGISANKDIQLTAVIGQQDTIQMSTDEITLSGGYLPLPANNDVIFKNSFE